MAANPPQTPGQAVPRSVNPPEAQNLNQIVIEYLNKKGYSRTEAMLRVESAHIDAEGRPILSKVEDYPDVMHEKAYSFLKNWIENSLDLYKPELRRVLYPVFIYSFLELASRGYVKACREFFENHRHEHETLHGHDLSQLSAISSLEHVQSNELAQLYMKNKYRIRLTRTTFNLLTYHVQENENQGGSVIIRLINDHLDIKTTSGYPTIIGAKDENELDENEGIPDHTTNKTGTDGVLPTVKLGPLPMDKDFAADVEDGLQQEDIKERQAAEHGIIHPGGTLIEEFKKIKREETEDSPLREDIPLPPYKGADIEREIRLVRECRNRFNLLGTPSAALPSVCMYTFHNTNDGLNCLDFSVDSALGAGGFQESYVRVWNLKGEKLVSAIPSENQDLVSSRRLIGHSGPVYGVSFSPNNQVLISCSEDKSCRLWSLDTWTALVVFKGHDRPVWDVKFGPFGHYFATASHDHTARLWSTDHINPLRIFAGHSSDVDCLAWHPNSAYLVTGSSDKTVRLWDIQRGSSARIFSGHTHPVTALAVSPDGKWIASASEDNTINMWDIASGKKLKTMRGHAKNSCIYSLAFSMEGTVLVSGGSDNTVRTWSVHANTGVQQAGEPESLNVNLSGSGSAAGTMGIATNLADSTSKVDSVTSSVLTAGGATTKGKKKEVIATSDHLTVFHTKRTPVYKVHFTQRNLVLAGGAYLP